MLVLLAVIQCIVLFGCRGGEDAPANDSTQQTTAADEPAPEPVADVDLVKDGKSQYVITYSSSESVNRTIAEYLSEVIYQKYQVMLSVAPSATKPEHEIMVGFSDKRDDVKEIENKIRMGNDFAVVMYGKKLIVYAATEEYGLNLINHLDTYILKENDAGTWTLPGDYSYIFSQTEDALMDIFSRTYAAAYEEHYGIPKVNYQRGLERFYTEAEYSHLLARFDHIFVTALRERMGKSAIIQIDGTLALYDGFVHKLNTDDYSATAKKSGESVLIPARFAEKYFGKTLTKDANGYVNLNEVCKNESGYTLELIENLAIILPQGTESYADGDARVNGYANRDYLTRCKKFLNNPAYPEPVTDAAETRVVIAAADPAFQEIKSVSWRQQQYETLYSPSIAIDEKDGQKILYASWESCQFKSGKELSANMVVAVSYDNGVTWKEIAEVEDVKQASLYVLDHTVYVFGCNESGSNNWYGIVARLNHDTMEFDTVRIEVNASGAPGAVVVNKGRIYRAYSGYVISAPTDSDLMDAANWTITSPRATTGEPSLTIGPDGEVYMLIRMSDASDPDGYAKILKVSEDGKKLSEVSSINGVPCFNSKVRLGTAWSFFNIRYDAATQKYYSLISKHTVATAPKYQRTVLVLVCSDDLINWTEVGSVLVEREMLNEVYAANAHGYQYVDFVMDGEDIVMIVREATGETNWFHDGKYATLYRIRNYKELLSEK